MSAAAAWQRRHVRAKVLPLHGQLYGSMMGCMMELALRRCHLGGDCRVWFCTGVIAALALPSALGTMGMLPGVCPGLGPCCPCACICCASCKENDL